MLCNLHSTPASYQLINSPKKLAWLHEKLRSSDKFSFDIETNHPTIDNKKKKVAYAKNNEIYVVGVSFAWDRRAIQDPWQSGNAAYVPLRRNDHSLYWKQRNDHVLGILKGVLESDVPKVAHNGKFDMRELFLKLGIRTVNLTSDTMLAHTLIDEDRVTSTHALKSKINRTTKAIVEIGCSDAYLNTDASQFKGDLEDALSHYDPEYRRYSKVPLDILYPYACADADLTLSLDLIFQDLLVQDGLEQVYTRIVIPLTHALMKMEIHGMPVDISYTRAMIEEQTALAEKYAEEVQEHAGKRFDVSSGAQVGRTLYEHMKFPGGQKNKMGWVTDDDALKKLDHPIGLAIKHFRNAWKLRSTYGVGTLDLIRDYSTGGALGWVRPNILQMATTGRVITNEPNLTNQPSSEEKGAKIIKSSYRCEPGYSFLMKDFSQVELRVGAHVSGEPNWVTGFNDGIDLHSITAHSVFKLNCDVSEVKEGYSDYRKKAKAVNFGILYGQTEFALATRLGMSVEEAKHLIEVDYFGGLPTLKDWIDRTHKFVEDHLYVSNIFGRKRHLPDAGLPVPHTEPWPDSRIRLHCYRSTIWFDDTDLQIEQLDGITAEDILDQIKKLPAGRYKKCHSCDYVKSCFVNAAHKYIKGRKLRALRQSVNAVVQGSAADMANWSIIEIDREFQRHPDLDAKLCLFIHDELGAYVRDDQIEKAERIMEDVMVRRLRERIKFKVPITTDTWIGKCWGDK